MRSITPANIFGEIRNAFLAFVLVFVSIGLAACTAHYPVNKSISSAKTMEDYSLEQKASERSSELLLLLTFSGGGTRAAAFSYGVLEALADTHVVINDKLRRLLDEVDAISSFSGGSFTAAYFEHYPEKSCRNL